MRAQNSAPLLFVAVVSLLVTDARAPSRRVLWVVPLNSALWSNLHGTVVLAAVLVAAAGVLRLLGPAVPRRSC